MGGLKIMLDIEMFDISFTGKQNAGFRIAFTDPRDKAMIKEDGYLISPGQYFFNQCNLCKDFASSQFHYNSIKNCNNR